MQTLYQQILPFSTAFQSIENPTNFPINPVDKFTPRNHHHLSVKFQCTELIQPYTRAMRSLPCAASYISPSRRFQRNISPPLPYTYTHQPLLTATISLTTRARGGRWLQIAEARFVNQRIRLRTKTEGRGDSPRTHTCAARRRLERKGAFARRRSV